MTADTVVGLLDESAADQPDRPLLRDCAGAMLTVVDVAALSAAGARSAGPGKVANTELAQLVSEGIQ